MIDSHEGFTLSHVLVKVYQVSQIDAELPSMTILNLNGGVGQQKQSTDVFANNTE